MKKILVLIKNNLNCRTLIIGMLTNFLVINAEATISKSYTGYSNNSLQDAILINNGAYPDTDPCTKAEAAAFSSAAQLCELYGISDKICYNEAAYIFSGYNRFYYNDAGGKACTVTVTLMSEFEKSSSQSVPHKHHKNIKSNNHKSTVISKTEDKQTKLNLTASNAAISECNPFSMDTSLPIEENNVQRCAQLDRCRAQINSAGLDASYGDHLERMDAYFCSYLKNIKITPSNQNKGSCKVPEYLPTDTITDKNRKSCEAIQICESNKKVEANGALNPEVQRAFNLTYEWFCNYLK